MGIEYRAYYRCDGCSTEFEDSDKVRIFKGIVVSGDGTKIYIQPEKMYCLSCIPLALDFENTVPETVQIIEQKEENFEIIKESELTILDVKDMVTKLKIDILNDIQDRYKEISEIKSKINNIQNEHNLLSDIFHQIDRDVALCNTRLLAIESVILHPLEKIDEQFENQISREEAKNFINEQKSEKVISDNVELTEINFDEDMNRLNKIIENSEITNEKPVKENQTISQEPETTSKNTDSETKEDKFEFPNGKENGKYLVLRMINNEISERKFAQKYGYKDTKDLREACGLKSLIGLYYSSNVYVDSNIIGEYRGNIKLPTKVINKMFFGVPNIVERKVHLYSDLGVALIEKELFGDTIEPVTYKISEDKSQVLETEPTTEIVKPFVPNIYEATEKVFENLKNVSKEIKKPVITSTQKKTFSKERIGDSYI
jgi:hypothetical protein